MATTTLAIAWLVHIVSWLVGMVMTRRSSALPREWLPELTLRLLMIALVAWSLVTGSGRARFSGPAGAALLALCVAGHAVAVVARLQLHRRWGIGTGPRTPVGGNAGAPDVARHGLYRWIRHPIYAGTGTSIAGQALLLQNLPSLIMLAGAALVIPWKVRRENRWIDRAGGTIVAAFMIMPSTLTMPYAPEVMFALAVHDGDAAFQSFDNDTARRYYQSAFAIDSTDCDVLWKLARANIHRGMVAPDDEKVSLYATAERLARRSVALCPDSSWTHFYLAVAIGQMTKVVGGKKRIELSKEVKREAEAALSLEPRHYGAMHVLGRWNYEVAGLGWFQKAAAKIVYGGVPPGASYQRAKEWFESAIAARPEMPLNHLWLGETLIKLDNYARAREELRTCIALDDVLWDDPHTRAQAQKRLREIEDKE